MNVDSQNVSPEQKQLAASIISKMTPEEINELIKIAGQNSKINNSYPQQQQPTSNSISNTTDTSKTNSPVQKNDPAPNTQNMQEAKIEKIKNLIELACSERDAKNFTKSNDNFLDAIMEIEEIKAKKIITQNSGFTSIEIECRLGYANLKCHLKEWESVMRQAKQIVTLDEKNGMGLLLLGKAYYHMNKIDFARKKLVEANRILPNNLEIIEYIKKIDPSFSAPNPSTSTNEETKEKTLPQNHKAQSTRYESKDVLIKEEVDNSPPIRKEPKPQQNQYPAMPPSFGNMDENSMSSMVNMMKSMDPAMLQSMLGAQGMNNISPDMIRMMQQFISPEMMKSMMGMPMDNMFRPRGTQQANNYPPNQNIPPENMNNPNQEAPAPEFDMQNQNPKDAFQSMMNNTGMITNILEMMKKNPQMLKSLMAMAPDNPLKKYIENASEQTLSRMIVVFSVMVKTVMAIMPVIKAVNRFKSQLLLLLIAYIVYRIFL